MNNIYNKEYYTSNNYANYLSRGERYKKTAGELADLLKSISLINEKSLILDYGCAVGFLMEGFIEEGYDNIEGYDISDWAVQQCLEKGLVVTDDMSKLSEFYDLGIFLDVLEHMTDEEIRYTFTFLNFNSIVVRIPVSTDGGNTYSLEVSRKDPTHINCKTTDQWKKVLVGQGFTKILPLNTLTIWDSPGVFSALCLK